MISEAKPHQDPESFAASLGATRRETSQFDYIIVGAGAAGGPLACRLVKAEKRVLVVEAGGDPKVAGEIHEAPLFHGRSTEHEELSWQFSVRHYKDDDKQRSDHKYDASRDPSSRLHDPSLPGSPTAATSSKGGIFYPRSSGLGGCTAHHAMIVVRPNDRDWDHIADLTNDDSWRARNMQPYFAKLEKCLYIEEYNKFFLRLFGYLYRFWLALLKFINPRAVLDSGGHGSKGWQPTRFISPGIIQSIFNTDNEFTKVLINSVFKVIREDSTIVAFLKRVLLTMGFVRSFDPNDLSTRAETEGRGVFLIPTGVGGEKETDEKGESLKGCRAGVREFLLKTQKEHPERLCILTGFHVTEILFDDTKSPPEAIGISTLKGAHLYEASPRHAFSKVERHTDYFVKPGGEIICCGGAFNTPQLLMLSGIGRESDLKPLDIKVRADLAGVGRNLQDRYEVCVVSELTEELKALATLSFDPANNEDKLLAEWRATREGLYTSNGGTIAILHRTKAADGPEPDIFAFGAPAAFRGYYWGWSRELLRKERGFPTDQRNLWTWVILKAYTHNNGGFVRLRNGNPLSTPEICFHSFEEGGDDQWKKDLAALEEAVSAMRKINAVAGSPLARELQPDLFLEQTNQDRVSKGLPKWEVSDWIKNEAWGHHASGTCKMGSDRWKAKPQDLDDKFAVLDSKFRVHGVQRLRVVDASVFPKIPGYFILAPILMASEKAADTLLFEAQNENYPETVREREEGAISARRKEACVSEDNSFIKPDERKISVAGSIPPEPNKPLTNKVGLALSGGGVRSSTFALGILQGLAEKDRLRHVDFLSTVSGGAFTGSFLGRLFTRDRCAVPDPCARVQEILRNNRSGPIRWLRTQANYLFASGTDDWLMTIGIVFRNLFTVHLVIAVFLLAVFGTLKGISELSIYKEPALSAFGTTRWGTISLWWWLPIALVVLLVAPIQLGFWLAPKLHSYRSHPPYALAAWILLIAGTSIGLGIPDKGTIAGTILIILALAWLYQEFARSGIKEEGVKESRLEGLVVRNRLTRALGEGYLILFGSFLWVILDSVAASFANKVHVKVLFAGILVSAPLLQMLRSWGLKLLRNREDSGLLLKIVAAILASALVVIVDLLAHKLFQFYGTGWGWRVVLFAYVLSLVLGRAFDFLNLSSLLSHYTARLVRTFLGASNPVRTERTSNVAADVQIADSEDDLLHRNYRPEMRGGPLHLISVCVNETVDHASQREIRERKGLIMTIGSFGISVGRQYFATWENSDAAIPVPSWLRFRRFLEGVTGDSGSLTPIKPIRFNEDPGTFHPLARRDQDLLLVEGLSLGQLTGISGAAFSTGLGRSSSPLQSLFMGLLNIRLGYWWSSGIRATERPGRFPANVWRRFKELPAQLFRVQALLFSEWRAHFDGPSHEFWNLTDGGHVDNTGLYELIRRRLPFIVFSDATFDPFYAFEALANVQRAVRVDFDTEIIWEDNLAGLQLPRQISSWVNMNSLGSLNEIKGNPSSGGPGSKHGAIAKIRYPNGEEGWLLLLKASITLAQPLDVRSYAQSNKAYPQDPTSDQIYDDEQWESYRKLGHAIALNVIA
jgi:choline dehydrogenase-like flavoprotein